MWRLDSHLLPDFEGDIGFQGVQGNLNGLVFCLEGFGFQGFAMPGFPEFHLICTVFGDRNREGGFRERFNDAVFVVVPSAFGILQPGQRD